MNATAKAVIYWGKDYLLFFGSNAGNLLRFDFPPNLARYMDITNREEFSIYIKAFLEHYKIAKVPVLLIASKAVLFVKDIAETLDIQNPEITNFISSVPFEHVTSKTLPVAHGMKVIALNRDFLEAITDSFEKAGFRTEAVVPYFSLDKFSELENDTFSPETAAAILDQYEGIKQFNILGSPGIASSGGNKNRSFLSSRNAKTLVLLGIFSFLLIILFIMIATNLSPPQPIRKIAITPVVKITSLPAARTTDSIIISSPEQVRIRIQFSSASAALVNAIRMKLADNGFNQVEEEVQENINAGKAAIIVNKTLPQAYRDLITSYMKETTADFLIQESDLSKYDAIIILPKNI